jgi:hypothetical protein
MKVLEREESKLISVATGLSESQQKKGFSILFGTEMTTEPLVSF